MSSLPECEWTLLVQAEFDGELDAAQAASLVQHRAGCASCARAAGDLSRSRELLRVATNYSASDTLRKSLQRQLGAAATSSGESYQRHRVAANPAFVRLAAAVAVMCVAASVLFYGMRDRSDLTAMIVDSHLRALQMDNHLVDVRSSDHHTVRPWFAGRLGFAPSVKELSGAGYELLGGRVDVIDGSSAAVVVYRAGKHVVNVFMLPQSAADSLQKTSMNRNGFHLRSFHEGDLSVWCVSDLGDAELDSFVEKWRSAQQVPMR